MNEKICLFSSSSFLLLLFWLLSFLPSILSYALTNTSFSRHNTILPLSSSCLQSSCLPLSFLPALSSTFPHRVSLSASVKQNSNNNKQENTKYIHNNNNNQSKQSPLKYLNSKTKDIQTLLKEGSNRVTVPLMVVDNYNSIIETELHGKSGEAFRGSSHPSFFLCSISPFNRISANSADALKDKREMFLRLFAQTVASSENTTASIPPPLRSSHVWRNDVEDPFDNMAGLLSNVPHMVDSCYVDVSDSGQQLTITQIKQRQQKQNDSNNIDDKKIKQSQLGEVSDVV
eukprot:GHVS01020245.1.p1 GENE.GHVS01020245.1~~GHVS01020245.1.p1  ORF type:complete len:287 (-),score=58.81 GHVS01020245.1:126-986(-)